MRKETTISTIYFRKGCRVANLTEEERIEFKKFNSEKMRKYFHSISEEQRDKIRKKRREYIRKLKLYGQEPTMPRPECCSDCPFCEFRTYPRVQRRELAGWYCLDTRPMKRVMENKCISREII